MMHRCVLLGFLALTLSCLPWQAFAQSEDQDLDQIEAEVHKQAPVPTPSHQESKADAPVQNAKMDSLSDLSKLQSFSDVSVLQRRYLPKTGRIQLFGGLSSVMNDPWNSSYGASLRAQYSFTEAWGIEGVGYFMSSSASQASNDLGAVNASAQSFGAMTGYYGGSVVWTPIYGKMSLSNKKIIPFDMYFSLGLGSTTLSGITGSNPSGPSFGTGQVFALTRSWGFRWDLTWNTYSIPSVGATNNVLLSAGVSFYFPEAEYR